MKCRIYLPIILLIATSLPSLAQTDSAVLSRAASSLTDYFNNHPVEKAYLHLDKEYYLPGDTIWFKAYTVIGQQHQLSALSGVLYSELINSKDSVIIRENIKLLVGIGWGDFDLPRTIKPGSYHIRAYTTWMRNAGPAYFYDQKITIGGQQVIMAPATVQLTAQAAAPDVPDVQFFPEGGQLVNGVRSKVAVKCVNRNGLGEDIKGVIVDEKGNEIADFATQHLGMGIFAITPQTGKNYKARIITADSLRYTIDLPPAQDEGFTLAVKYSGADSIYIKVAANDKLFSTQQNSTFYLLAQSGGKVYYTAAGKLSAPVFTTTITKSRFPTGIIQFTLFSQTGDPLNERVLFVQNDDVLKINLSSQAQTYNARQKVKIDLGVNSTGKPLAIASFSVSVTNESRVPVNENTEGTILNNLLLTSDIKGYIEQPNYYFNNENAETRANLDILMLTQGYRRFDWKQVLKNSDLPPEYMPETSLQLAGSIKTPSGKPVPNGKIILTATKANYIKDTVADGEGNFKFSNLNFADTIRTILRARKASNGSNVAIYVQKTNYPGIIKSNVNTDTIAKLTPEMLKNIADYRAGLKQDSLKNGRRLKEVVIKAKKEPKPDIFNGYGTSMEYDADMQRFRREYPTLSIALPSLIPGAHYTDGGPIIYEAHPARLIIDGLPHQTSDIDLINVNEIESVRMISATNLHAAKLIVTTKRYAGTDTAATTLKEVKIVASKIRKEPDLSQSQSLHPGAADQVIMGDDLGDCANLSDCLQGKTFGVGYSANGTPLNKRSPIPAPMSIIVDGNIMDGSHLNELNPDDIYSIEVLRSVAAYSIYGSSIKAGALVITMRHGPGPRYLASMTPQGLITYPFKGYYVPRTFYSPKYDVPNTENWKGADLRSTIYWNPNIITDKTGKASFEFYNADTKGSYRVVVEGIDDNGNIGRQVYRYKVE